MNAWTRWNLKTLIYPEPLTYDGTQLSPHWIYRTVALKGDALVAFKDPNEYLRKLRFHQRVKTYRDYGIGAA